MPQFISSFSNLSTLLSQTAKLFTCLMFGTLSSMLIYLAASFINEAFGNTIMAHVLVVTSAKLYGTQMMISDVMQRLELRQVICDHSTIILQYLLRLISIGRDRALPTLEIVWVSMCASSVRVRAHAALLIESARRNSTTASSASIHSAVATAQELEIPGSKLRAVLDTRVKQQAREILIECSLRFRQLTLKSQIKIIDLITDDITKFDSGWDDAFAPKAAYSLATQVIQYQLEKDWFERYPNMHLEQKRDSTPLPQIHVFAQYIRLVFMMTCEIGHFEGLGHIEQEHESRQFHGVASKNNDVDGLGTGSVMKKRKPILRRGRVASHDSAYFSEDEYDCA